MPVLWEAAPPEDVPVLLEAEAPPEDVPVLLDAEAPPEASPAAAFREASPPAFEDCPPVFSEGAFRAGPVELPVEAPDPLPAPRAELRVPPDCADLPLSPGAAAEGASPRFAEVCPPPTPRG